MTLLLSAHRERLCQSLPARLRGAGEHQGDLRLHREEFGLPKAIRTDNGVALASPHALFGLSKLSVWWLRLGIHIERIQPGRPLQNGRHERMHLILKKEATKPAAQNFLQQQAKFDDFLDCYNEARPHMALGPGVPYPPAGQVLPANERSRHHLSARAVVRARSVLGGLHREYSLATVLA